MSNKLTSIALGVWGVFAFGIAQAAYIDETWTVNGSFDRSQFILSSSFTAEYDEDINTEVGLNISELTTHASILGRGNNTFDFYSFNSVIGQAFFDIDYAKNSGGSFDSWIELYDSSHTRIAYNDNSNTTESGSLSVFDSFLNYEFEASGLYYLAVGQTCDCKMSRMSYGVDYTLHISQGYDHQVSAVPVPAAVWLFGTGLLALFGVSRRNNRP